MRLQRAGVTLFGSGLLVASVAAVLGRTELCESPYCVVTGTDPLAWLVALGAVVMVGGAVVGGVGLLQSADE